jgi:F0F1-type ATP synthase membrane subunit a
MALVMFFFLVVRVHTKKNQDFLQGLAGFRAIVTFVRDDIAKILERKICKYMLYLLTIFFLSVNNLLV